MSGDDRLARDAHHRERALDPRRSFLVQAPAGSGKTELLIQRYLALLATVPAPQRVVAVTFTRKAANEMRERVIAALREARGGTEVTAHHARVTRGLAQAVLERAAALGWSILDYPAQLGIGTIDSLCGRIARQAPLASRLGVWPRPVDDARGLYADAARAALARADAGSSSWRKLLERLDNDAESLVRYLAQLLEKRDQWLWHVVGRDPAQWRPQIEARLAADIESGLRAAREAFGPPATAALFECARYATRFFEGDNDWLAYCATCDTLPPADADHLPAWRALADWLLVRNEPQLRKVMDKRQGVPPKTADSGRGQALKDAMLAALAESRGLVQALHTVGRLPSPTYDDDAWAAIEALLEILPRAVAELDVVFATRGTVDYTHFTLSALNALADADAPSELLLRLDLALDHLLVDEFQDTSFAQYRLIEMLTEGWTPGDGRTLFAVGDPMQSIYRFRNAEVRLFLEARERGQIGHVPVEFLDLGRNFRSQGHLVAWVNRVFPDVLAPRNDSWSGAVAFAPSAAAHAQSAEGLPTLDLAPDLAAEAACVVARIQAALPALGKGEEVAVLMRARNDLVRILPALRAAGIPFAAVEIDALAERQSVRDLVSLTHALIQPADRLAALAVLRAPWCGVALADLLAVSATLGGGLPGLAARLSEVTPLSEDGAARLRRAVDILAPAFAEHARAPLADRVRGAWLALGGPATVEEAIDLAAADDYFDLLRAYEAGGDVADWQAFVDELARRFATSTQDVTAPVKVMTLFKAKGLEFHTVVIPGLAAARGSGEVELLKWRTRPDGALLLATVRARGGDKDPVYEYLQWLAEAESEHELGRLLYVGATRARRRLHLVATASADDDGEWKKPKKGSALAKLWDALAPERGAPPPPLPPAETTPRMGPPLRRLPLAWQAPSPAPTARSPAVAAMQSPPPRFEWARAMSAAVGTVSHRLLAQAAREGLGTFDDARLTALTVRVRTELVGEGVEAGELDRAQSDVLAVLRAVRTDARAHWLFDPAHAERQSEWALAGVDAGAVVHVTLDRSFVAGGTRWIVDFKTSTHEGAGTKEFLDRELARYRPQLERYARVVRAIDPRPIRLGLYYPLVRDGWREWAFEAPGTQAELF